MKLTEIKITIYGDERELPGEDLSREQDEFFYGLEVALEMGANAVAEKIRQQYPNLNVEVSE